MPDVCIARQRLGIAVRSRQNQEKRPAESSRRRTGTGCTPLARWCCPFALFWSLALRVLTICTSLSGPRQDQDLLEMEV